MMIPPDEYVAAVDHEEHPNVVIMAGALDAALHLAGVDAQAEAIDGTVTGRLIVRVPFLRSSYLLTLERIPDPAPEDVRRRLFPDSEDPS